MTNRGYELTEAERALVEGIEDSGDTQGLAHRVAQIKADAYAAGLADRAASTAQDNDRLRAAVEELADDLCGFNPGHGDFLTAGHSLRAALAHPEATE